jgi:GNAT superfamily N-acetyltransferase
MAADVSAIARLHSSAFAGEIGPVVGLGYLSAMIRWFVDAPGGLALVAQDEGAITGYVFGAPDGYGPRLTRLLMPKIVVGVLANLPKVIAHPSFARQIRSRLANLVLRREPKSVVFDSTPEGCFCLVGIATAAEVRGQGVGRGLIERFCTQVPGRRVILDVFRDNAPARALYERCGFRVLAEDGRVVRMLRVPD